MPCCCECCKNCCYHHTTRFHWYIISWIISLGIQTGLDYVSFYKNIYLNAYGIWCTLLSKYCTYTTQYFIFESTLNEPISIITASIILFTTHFILALIIVNFCKKCFCQSSKQTNIKYNNISTINPFSNENSGLNRKTSHEFNPNNNDIEMIKRKHQRQNSDQIINDDKIPKIRTIESLKNDNENESTQFHSIIEMNNENINKIEKKSNKKDRKNEKQKLLNTKQTPGMTTNEINENYRTPEGIIEDNEPGSDNVNVRNGENNNLQVPGNEMIERKDSTSVYDI